LEKSQSNRFRLKPHEIEVLKKMRETETRNILVIGDLHEPFCLDSYLQFCIDKYYEYNCTEVVFIGDVIDNHYSSYHESSADGLGGLDELELAIKRIARWRNAFPIATVIIGNHDRIIMRKAQTSSIPSKWIKSYKEVLEVPNWNFVERYETDGVQYIHGEGGTARTKCRADMMNTVQGHLHTQAYCEHYVGKRFRVFGMQVGCGINHKSYAMAYAKYGKRPAVGCAVVLNGQIPINLLMPL
jgi:metallophosphoesterase superfamily enzyme